MSYFSLCYFPQFGGIKERNKKVAHDYNRERETCPIDSDRQEKQTKMKRTR